MIYFIGAGPGAADLITVKGKELLEKADLVIYAGSLVNPELLKYCKPECTIMNSATMTLEEVIAAMVPAAQAGQLVVRLHTGDPAFTVHIASRLTCCAATTLTTRLFRA